VRKTQKEKIVVVNIMSDGKLSGSQLSISSYRYGGEIINGQSDESLDLFGYSIGTSRTKWFWGFARLFNVLSFSFDSSSFDLNWAYPTLSPTRVRED
jgi:hypothetical protein